MRRKIFVLLAALMLVSYSAVGVYAYWTASGEADVEFGIGISGSITIIASEKDESSVSSILEGEGVSAVGSISGNTPVSADTGSGADNDATGGSEETNETETSSDDSEN